MKKIVSKVILPAVMACTALQGSAQPMPSVEENIPFMVTFSKGADKSFGDDDFVSVFFFVVPESRKEPVYIRVYDPEIGGNTDEDKGGFNSKTNFSIYGGKGAHSNPDSRKTNPEGKYKSGVQLANKVFGSEPEYDEKWYTFGPFNPVEGELQSEFGGYVFKMVIEGLAGDDGNLYKLFLSSKPDQNIAIEGGNGFTYEYCIRTNEKNGNVSHLYPFINKGVVSIKLNTYDYDNEGIIRVVSVAKKGDLAEISNDANWTATTFKIEDAEVNTSLDVQIITKTGVKNNNIVLFITNQFGESMPFFTVPIGGAPKFKYKIGVKPK